MPDPVLAISPDDDRMHVGADATVLSHVTAEAAQGGDQIAWQFFDARGVALAVVDHGAGGVLEPADPNAALPLRPVRQILVSRIDLVLAHAQLRLDLKIAERIEGHDPPRDKESVRMVRVHGELRDVLIMLAALDEDLDPTPHGPNPGSWWHNFWAH